MKFAHTVIGGIIITIFTTTAPAAVTPEEAKQLGTTLTLVGAERAANADGSIPEYTGGLTKPPASFKKDSGIRPDPFEGEKPQFSITAKNMSAYETKLTAIAKELLKRYPNSFRIDVYPTHRTAAVPKYVSDNTAKNATSAKLNGLALQNAYAGFPFPIPKTGIEAMFNNYLKYSGNVNQYKFDGVNVDAEGKATLSSTGEVINEYPMHDLNKVGYMAETDPFFKMKMLWRGPARHAGEGLMLHDMVNPLVQPRRAWIYLPGQRRVKLAPDVGYDTPNTSTSGMTTFDDASVFNGPMDRFDFKLIGKKEMYIPYNDYKITYVTTRQELATPNHIDPNAVRWELHRVWVVEATLKPGMRHIYHKRIFYLDEDSWVAIASDQYDARGTLYRGSFFFMAPAYDIPAPIVIDMVTYDLIAGSYAVLACNLGSYYGLKFIKPLPENDWSPDSLAGAGVR